MSGAADLDRRHDRRRRDRLRHLRRQRPHRFRRAHGNDPQISGRFAQGGDVGAVRHHRHRSGRPAGGPDGASATAAMPTATWSTPPSPATSPSRGRCSATASSPAPSTSAAPRSSSPTASTDRRTPSTCTTSTPRPASRRRYRRPSPPAMATPPPRRSAAGSPSMYRSPPIPASTCAASASTPNSAAR